MSGPAYPFALRESFNNLFITDTCSTCVLSSIFPFFIAFLSSIDKYSGFFAT
nr:hypothetical protein [Fusobacterium massiliense]